MTCTLSRPRWGCAAAGRRVCRQHLLQAAAMASPSGRGWRLVEFSAFPMYKTALQGVRGRPAVPWGD